MFALHRFLARRAFYPLLICTTLAFAFLFTRIVIAHRLHFAFLVWNLFLAWIPYWCSLYAIHLRQNRPGARWHIRANWMFWLIMFPNAPYILTDIVHLADHGAEMPWWFDSGLIITFALAGCFLAIASLRIMHELVRPRVGEIGGWLFVMTISMLTGFGIYLGRFGRFNSWDLLLRPHRVVARTVDSLTDPFAHARIYGITLMFGALLLVIYVAFISMSSRALTDDATA